MPTVGNPTILSPQLRVTDDHVLAYVKCCVLSIQTNIDPWGRMIMTVDVIRGTKNGSVAVSAMIEDFNHGALRSYWVPHHNCTGGATHKEYLAMPAAENL